ncbi:hypothetical protein [Opitutus terrae]|uniref:HEPN AbiU2-like domain-containing protein n=1 Tax=Opitutus terrae (strain DSM 11246 / JCM 15787 / PB90-1) TaxID=452637 RepID=B1ZYF2_OPITP|nr:hypothetical protein [Opitutus terrae]ACB77050.1 hypothetical protein Oter_3775 [Opitutus terrae PB90-1]
MTPEELEDAQLLWKASYASEVFRKVQATCQHVVDSKMETSNPLYYPLIVSIYVLYGRPFKKSRDVGRIPENVVPADLMELHRSLLRHRDTVFAHTDADADQIDGLGELNQVRFWVTPERVHIFSTEFRARPPLLPDIIRLAKILEDKMEYHTSRLMRKHIDSVPNRLGQFRINVRGLDQEFVTEVPPHIP